MWRDLLSLIGRRKAVECACVGHTFSTKVVRLPSFSAFLALCTRASRFHALLWSIYVFM